MADENYTWAGFARGLGFEPREQAELIGQSGQTHQFASLAIDEKQKRLLLVSKLLDPKMASLVHWDVATALPEYRILTTRQVTLDFQMLAQAAVRVTGSPILNLATILPSPTERVSGRKNKKKKTDAHEEISKVPLVDATKEALGRFAEPFIPFVRAAEGSGIGFAEHLISIVRQATAYDWPNIISNNAKGETIFNIESILKIDGQMWDRESGICPFPIYEMSEVELELLKSGTDIEAIHELLNRIGISQYFRPPVDQAALAIIDRGMGIPERIKAAVDVLQSSGHLLTDSELLPPTKSIPELLEQLTEAGYIAEGERQIEITKDGKTIRDSIKYRPREAAFFKLFRNLSISVETKNWFKNINLNVPKE